jgi:hypothetical protein
MCELAAQVVVAVAIIAVANITSLALSSFAKRPSSSVNGVPRQA